MHLAKLPWNRSFWLTASLVLVYAGVSCSTELELSHADARAYQEEWGRRLKLPLAVTNSLGMKLVLIPPGEFVMGSPPITAVSGPFHP